MSISIWDYEKPLEDVMMLSHDHMAALVLKHEQQIKDIAAHLLEIKQLVTPMMEFNSQMPTKLVGPNLVGILNAAGFYKKKEWVGLTDDEVKECHYDEEGFMIERDVAMAALEAKLKDKNNG